MIYNQFGISYLYHSRSRIFTSVDSITKMLVQICRTSLKAMLKSSNLPLLLLLVRILFFFNYSCFLACTLATVENKRFFLWMVIMYDEYQLLHVYICTDSCGIIAMYWALPQRFSFTGDLTDAKGIEKESSMQYKDEWDTYSRILKQSNILNRTVWLDTRGNHGKVFLVEF